MTGREHTTMTYLTYGKKKTGEKKRKKNAVSPAEKGPMGEGGPPRGGKLGGGVELGPGGQEPQYWSWVEPCTGTGNGEKRKVPPRQKPRCDAAGKKMRGKGGAILTCPKKRGGGGGGIHRGAQLSTRGIREGWGHTRGTVCFNGQKGGRKRTKEGGDGFQPEETQGEWFGLTLQWAGGERKGTRVERTAVGNWEKKKRTAFIAAPVKGHKKVGWKPVHEHGTKKREIPRLCLSLSKRQKDSN